jgi:hypothetical protein
MVYKGKKDYSSQTCKTSKSRWATITIVNLKKGESAATFTKHYFNLKDMDKELADAITSGKITIST